MTVSRNVYQDENSATNSEKKNGFFSRISSFISDIVSDSGVDEGPELTTDDYDPDMTYGNIQDIVEDKTVDEMSNSFNDIDLDDDVTETVTPAIFAQNNASFTSRPTTFTTTSTTSASTSAPSGIVRSSFVADKPNTNNISAVGFDLSGSATQSQSQPTSYAPKSSVSSGSSFGGKGVTVQVFEPRDISASDDICAALMAGSIVIVNLSATKDDSAKIRIIDYLAGCSKGIGATVHQIEYKSIFMAAPKGVDIKKPSIADIEQPQAQPQPVAPKQQENPASPLMTGFTFKADPSNSGASFTPRF